MKHKRMTNRRIKQMMGDINHDGLFDEVVNNDKDAPIVERKDNSAHEVPPNLNLDSDSK